MSQQEIDFNEWISEKWNDFIDSMKNHFEDYELNKATVAHNISLLIILVSAFTVRIFPILEGWDITIKAFDPHIQIKAAEYINNNGFFNFLIWKDSLSWYPYGRAGGTSLYIGVPLAILSIYYLLHFIGFNVSMSVAAYFVPVVFGTLGVYFSYLLGKEVISPRAGLFSAMIMVATPAYVSRSIAGFVDNEAVGVWLSVMTLYFFVRSLNRDSNKSAFLAGISLAMLGGSWGAFRFTYDLLPLYALVIIITGNYSTRFLKTYTVTIGTSTLLMILVPRVGGGFLTEIEGIAPVAMIAFLLLFGIIQDLSKDLSNATFRRIIFYGFIFIAILFVGLLAGLLAAGYIQGVGDKFISVILPGYRNKLPLIDSVSEHLPLSWGNLYSNLGVLTFFMPLGVYYTIRNPHERNLFVLTFTIVTIYFSGSMVRLMLLLAPAAAIATALAIDNLLRPYALAAHGRISMGSKLKMKSINNQNAVATYVTVFVLMLIMLSAGVNKAATSYSIPELTPPASQDLSPNNIMTDWLDTFQWMRTHSAYYDYTPDNPVGWQNNTSPPVMLSWWDYGYYITTEGNTVTLVDNGTTNSTQIGVVGAMLMYNATFALPLMYQYDVDYVLVVPGAGQLQLGSDLGKAVWMIRIAEKYTPEFGITEKGYYDSRQGYQDKFYDSVLYQLMAYRSPDMTSTGQDEPPFVGDGGGLADIRSHVVTSIQYFTEVFRSDGVVKELPGDYPVIRIYKVLYPDDIQLRVNEFNMKIAQMRANLEAQDSNNN